AVAQRESTTLTRWGPQVRFLSAAPSEPPTRNSVGLLHFEVQMGEHRTKQGVSGTEHPHVRMWMDVIGCSV
ncbi:MAG: hypothetical protein K6T81_05625, partial [Alicyclobacillus macrosporangiidus]|uniref:hypothetical protein n=1 Tax=Alicyclobacillus macrosporangiidus TaxID=392015 RepID=UPI0026E9C2FA